MQQFITIEEARTLVLAQVGIGATETIGLENTFQRTLAESVNADRDYPPFNRAAMDGIAICSTDILEKNIFQYKVMEVILAGSESSMPLTSGYCYRIMTGAALPDCANVVIKIEDCTVDDNHISISKDVKVKPFLNIAQQGEDAKDGSCILELGTVLNATCMAALASVGASTVSVYRKPTVAIISTGAEVVEVGSAVSPFQIRNSNTYALQGFLAALGLENVKSYLVGDDTMLLKHTISEALTADVVIITGGVSMGAADFVPQILDSLGVTPIFHKVKIKPGKPVWFGRNKDTAVFALPGNPMSVQATFKLLVEPYILAFMGQSTKPITYLPLASDRKKKVALDEYFPCKLSGIKPTTLVPIANNGSGDIISNIHTHGLARHSLLEGDLQADDWVEFISW